LKYHSKCSNEPLPIIIEPVTVLDTIEFLKKLLDFFSKQLNSDDGENLQMIIDATQVAEFNQMIVDYKQIKLTAKIAIQNNKTLELLCLEK